MKNLKFKIIALLFALVPFLGNAQAIVGGAGTLKVNGDPDLIAGLSVINQKTTASVAIDTVTATVYVYDVTKTIGVRWNAFGVNQTFTAAAPASNAFTIALSGSGSSYSITGGSGITVGGTAGAYTITNSFVPPTTQYDDDVAAGVAGVAGVALGNPYRASQTNRMGVPAGTVIVRNF
jgi:hypothetical protein